MPNLLLTTTTAAQQAWQPPAWVAITLILITWVGFIITYLRFRWESQRMQMELEKAKKERDKELQDMAVRVCREFVNSKDYREDRDQRVREIANEQIDSAFTARAKSFVSMDRFEERTRAIENKQEEMNKILQANTEKIGNMSGQITQAVTTQLTAFLATRVFGPKDQT